MIHWYETTSKAKWQIPVNDLSFGNFTLFTDNYKKNAILNSFFQGVSLPSEMFKKLADLLQKQVRLTSCNLTTGFCKFPGICSKQVRNLYDIKI
jgi:hypothetical protein